MTTPRACGAPASVHLVLRAAFARDAGLRVGDGVELVSEGLESAA